MLEINEVKQYRTDAQGLAERFLNDYASNHEVSYPINPFQILTSLGIGFVFRAFDGIEGLYFPKENTDDTDLVVINSKRPITRQRFTAAHELCHFIKDRNSCVCMMKTNAPIEKYADRFASALLMPKRELLRKIDERLEEHDLLNEDDVLIIADHFGVSFSACYYRIRNLFDYSLGFLENDKKKFKPDHRRQELGMSYLSLYESLFDAWTWIKNSVETEYAKHIFKTNYVYNDSRLEGVATTKEATAEIVEDLENKRHLSVYYDESYDAYCHVAGHSSMYDDVFSMSTSEHFDVFTLIPLNRALFSCMPHPEYGGMIRTSNPVVLEAKFETVDFRDIYSELSKLNDTVKELDSNFSHMRKSEIIESAIRIHHRITVIHPFGDGNGRTSRAFLNLMFLRYRLIPTYTKLEVKEEYYTALESADKYADYTRLYEFFMKALIRSHVELGKR